MQTTIGIGASSNSSNGAQRHRRLAISGAPSLPAKLGLAFSFTPSVVGGFGPLSFSVSSGTLPAGLSLNSETGEISGTPSEAGTFASVVISASDSFGHSADSAPFDISVLDIWTPLSEDDALGLDHWWAGTDSGLVTLDGSQKASGWEDRVGGVIASQADASKRLSYNSANGYLETTSAAWLDIPGQANSHLTKWGLHVMWADLSGSGSADGTLWFLNGSGGADGNRKPLIDYRRSTIAIGAGWRANGNYNIAIVNLPGDDAWHIGLTRLNGGVNKTSVNGGNEVTTGSGISLPVGTSIAGMIGDYRWGLIGNGLANWRVRHILTGTADISSALRDKLVGWAAWEGGLQALLPSDHPYKAERPYTDAA